MTRKKVLFISHEASRSGAPIVLLHFLKWFKANTDIPFLILLKIGGELESDFEDLAPVIVLSRVKPGLVERVSYRLRLHKFKRLDHFRKLKKKLSQENIGLIYSNTVTNGEVLEFLSSLKCPVITHIHELEYTINCCGGIENFKQVQHYTQHYIAVAKAVKDNLVKHQKIEASTIDVIHEFIPTQVPIKNSQPQVFYPILEELNIPQEALVVGASGTMSWRKGADLFVQLARAVNQRQLNTPVHFVWVGGENNGIYFNELIHDVRHAGLEQYVHFTGVQPNPLDYFRVFNVFTLLSREDPFPLVLLEAASIGKPIVCFDNSGGAPEFVEDDCGFVVPYLDIEAMADKVVALMKSVDLRQSLGERAAKKAWHRHDVTVLAPKILNLIERFI